MVAMKHLFQPISIGGMEVPNRIFMAALGLRYEMERYRDFYVERARGGAGLLCCNLITLDREGPGPQAPAIERDARIPVLQEMTTAIHLAGSKVAAQLAARLNWVRADGTVETVGPSAVNLARRSGSSDPRPLTTGEVQYVVEGMGEAARRAREAGFDAVELHALAGTSLLSQFMSPVTNSRTDGYGGSLEARLCLLLETMQSIRDKAGADFPVIVRISGTDFISGGYGLDEARQVAIVLERQGVSALNVSTGWYRVSTVPFIQMGVPQGAWVCLAEGVKQVVRVPVIGGTNVRDPGYAEGLLAAGKVDMVYMARALIADPQLPLKAARGDVADIRPCTACCHCMDSNLEESGLECSVNARAGKEAHYPVVPAAQPRKVLVIGGGPAGMEAARVAAERGHRVVLWESGKELGGALLTAALPPRKQSIGDFTRYLAHQMERLRVEVRLHHTATTERVLEEKADVVVVATGAEPVLPQIPGVDRELVSLAADVLAGRRKAGQRVVVVGGEMVGCEVAEFLAQQGREVTLLARRERVADDMGRTYRWVMLRRLQELGVCTETVVNVVEVKDDGVVGFQQGVSRFFPAGSVVLAVGFYPDSRLVKALEGKVKELHAIGDCVRPGRIAGAIEEGLRLGLQL